MVAFTPVTKNIRMNNNKSSSKGTKSIPAIFQFCEIACNPTQRYDVAIPRLARLPEFLKIASTWNKITPRQIITATPISP